MPICYAYVFSNQKDYISQQNEFRRISISSAAIDERRRARLTTKYQTNSQWYNKTKQSNGSLCTANNRWLVVLFLFFFAVAIWRDSAYRRRCVRRHICERWTLPIWDLHWSARASTNVGFCVCYWHCILTLISQLPTFSVWNGNEKYSQRRGPIHGIQCPLERIVGLAKNLRFGRNCANCVVVCVRLLLLLLLLRWPHAIMKIKKHVKDSVRDSPWTSESI